MNQKVTLGSAMIATSLLLSQIGLAQSVVYSDCSSGTCNGSSGLFGPNTGEHGTMKAWAWHSSWGDYWARNQAAQRPWHGGYYWMRTGQPTALVVPPVITMQQNYSWGVSQNTMTPVYHQFGGVAPNGAGGGMFRGTPYWPTHTEQFGVYPVRGPW